MREAQDLRLHQLDSSLFNNEFYMKEIRNLGE